MADKRIRVTFLGTGTSIGIPVIARVIEQINSERAYLTHIIHFLGLHDEVEAKLPANVKLDYDNLVIELIAPFTLHSTSLLPGYPCLD